MINKAKYTIRTLRMGILFMAVAIVCAYTVILTLSYPEDFAMAIAVGFGAFVFFMLGFAFLYNYWWIKTDKQSCPKCHAWAVKERVVATVQEGTPAEMEYNCPSCGTVGYWAYGSFDPSYPYAPKEERIDYPEDGFDR